MGRNIKQYRARRALERLEQTLPNVEAAYTHLAECAEQGNLDRDEIDRVIAKLDSALRNMSTAKNNSPSANVRAVMASMHDMVTAVRNTADHIDEDDEDFDFDASQETVADSLENIIDLISDMGPNDIQRAKMARAAKTVENLRQSQRKE